MKQKLIIVWMVFHLLFIIFSNISSAYDTYNKFNHKNWNELTFLDKILYSSTARVYGICTGAETGYGFFGFNVRSNGIFIAECGGKKLTPEFKSAESSIRFFSLSASLTDKLLEDTEPGNTRKVEKIMDKYNDLAVKNIAVTLFNKYHCRDTSITLSYNLISFPKLSEFRKNKSLGYEIDQLKVYTFSYD